MGRCYPKSYMVQAKVVTLGISHCSIPLHLSCTLDNGEVWYKRDLTTNKNGELCPQVRLPSMADECPIDQDELPLDQPDVPTPVPLSIVEALNGRFIIAQIGEVAGVDPNGSGSLGPAGAECTSTSANSAIDRDCRAVTTADDRTPRHHRTIP